MKWTLCALLAATLLVSHARAADDPVFSGPQVDEKITSLKATHVLGESAGDEFDPVTKADGGPLLLVFVHEVTRPSVGLTRLLSQYAHMRHKDGLHSAVIFLTADATETEQWMKRARHALPKNVPVGISVDGQEGPGAYGLNREMSLTILVAKDNQVTANFALIQPSVEQDGPKVLQAIVDAVGSGEVPPLAKLTGGRGMRGTNARGQGRGDMPAELAGLLRGVINMRADEDQVDTAADKLTAWLDKHPENKKRVGQIARRIIDADKLENYGTPKAQEHIKSWAEKYK